jgi:hypothetical protein
LAPRRSCALFGAIVSFRELELQVHPASVQDRDGAPSVLKASRARFPFIEKNVRR